MKLILKERFKYKLENQIEYIAKDKPQAAKRFQRKIIEKIKEIPKHPLSCRKSIFFEEEAIRDLVVDGYIILFRINLENIEVFGFNKYEDGF